MKKKIGVTLLLLTVLLIICKAYQHHILNPTDFKVQQYFFFHGDDFTNARLNVIACVADYDTDKMMNGIRRYYTALYGEADRLDIMLSIVNKILKLGMNVQNIPFTSNLISRYLQLQIAVEK